MNTKIHNPKNGIYAVTADYAHAIEIVKPERLPYVSGRWGSTAVVSCDGP